MIRTMKAWAMMAVLGIPSIGAGQSLGSVQGTITDVTGAPLIGATVQQLGINQPNAIASGISGNYNLPINRPGNASSIQLRCSFIGMKPADTTIAVSEWRQPWVWNVQLEEEALGLDAVVISAGRFEQSAAEVTVSLDVLPPRLVESKGTTSLETALEQNPGVSMVDGEPQIRSGSGFSYGAGSRVMILVDDLPVLSGDAGRPTWGFLPLENLEQIEIIKGAASVLYGSAALSGVINVRTRYPDARPLTRISVQHGIFARPRSAEAKTWAGSNMQSNVRFLHSQRMGSWDVVVGGNILGDEGFLSPVDSGDSRGYRPWEIDHFASEKRGRFNVNLRKRESRIDGLQYGINTNWQKGDFLNTLIWEQAPNGIYGSYEGAATRTRQLVGTLDPHMQFVRGTWRHSLRGRWFHLINDNDNDQGNASDVLYSEYQAAWRHGEGLDLTGGLVFSQTWSEAELYSGGQSDGNNTATNAAAFLQINWSPLPQLHFSGGGRFEHFRINENQQGQPVFRAGLNWQAAKATYMRASWGQGFRFPTIAERFIRTGLGSLQIYPNPGLQPESAWAGEWGVKQGFKWGGLIGFIDLAVFHQRYSDFIEFTFGTWGGAGAPLAGLGFTSLNTGETQNTGMEITWTGRWTVGNSTVDFLTGYTYTQPIALEPDLNYNPFEGNSWITSYTTTSYNTDNNLLKYRSPHLVRADVEWRQNRLSTGISLRYQTALRNFDAAFVQFEQEGFVEWGLENWLNDHPNLPWIVDLRASWKQSKGHSWSILVSNALNAEYSIRPLTMEAPRLVQLMYTYEIQ
ncbi:MAG: TonB-dependent receptor [Flavobacteriales bacterium]